MDREILKKELEKGVRSWYFKDEKSEVLNQMLEKCGKEHILAICIEELSELQKELTKTLRGNPSEIGVMEELVDVSVCIDYISIIFDLDYSALKNVESIKFERMKKFLEGD